MSQNHPLEFLMSQLFKAMPMRNHPLPVREFMAGLYILIFCCSLLPARAAAHHSFAMFDNNNHIRLRGIVTHFQWTNPHVYIELEVKEKDDTVERWTIECANPGILMRVGWKFNMIKKGDEITVVVAPLRSGKAGALLKQAQLPDGTKMENGGPAGPPKISIETGEPLE